MAATLKDQDSMGSDEGNWWTRSCGGREVLRLALPLVISTGFFSLMLFVDRMFLFWHSKQAVAAAMPAGMLHWTLVCFPLGLAAYANTFVAQYHGARRPDRVGAVIGQAMWLGIAVTPMFLCVAPLASFLFHSAGEDTLVRQYEIVYFQVLTVGAGAAVMGGALSSFFTGRGETRIVMYVNIAATMLNGVLDYGLIFGRWGLPELGIAGAAWATVASQWFKLLVYWVLLHRGSNPSTYQLKLGRRFDRPLAWRMIRFGSPNGLQMLVEGVAFTLILMKMRELGTGAMTATTVAFSVNSVAFIPLIGLGISVSTLVGQQLTQGRADLATRATWSAVGLGLIYSAFFGVLYIGMPDLLLIGHAAGSDAREYDQVRDIAVVLLRFAAVFCLFDAFHVIFVGAIKGAGDTWFVLTSTIGMSIVGVTVGWLGALAGGGLYWWWSVITAWTAAQAIVYGGRFFQGRWRSMRVIESEAVDGGLGDELTQLTPAS